MTTTVAVLGATGSIGRQTFEVIAAEGDRYEVVAIGAGSSVAELVRHAHAVRPKLVALADPARAGELQALVPTGTEVIAGPDALAQAATTADVVVNGVVGFAGLGVTVAALAAGKRLALANKESLIAGGPVVQQVRATPGAEIVPVDSEHCALHQCLRAGRTAEVRRVVLTASGGPFRGRVAGDLAGITVEDALAHPTWSMGPKITVDSSTLMNKGLEVIEAHELFGVGYDAIDVVVHPQSIVHSMVEFADGATIAQLSNPDMRLPIAYALAFPERSGVPFGSWTPSGSLDFEPPDRATFRCLDLAYAAGRAGGSAPAWLNAANEVAVAAFLAGNLDWLGIAEVLDEALDLHDGTVLDDVDSVIDVDRRARVAAEAIVRRRAE